LARRPVAALARGNASGGDILGQKKGATPGAVLSPIAHRARAVAIVAPVLPRQRRMVTRLSPGWTPSGISVSRSAGLTYPGTPNSLS